jgi:hypothetical protein
MSRVRLLVGVNFGSGLKKSPRLSHAYNTAGVTVAATVYL